MNNISIAGRAGSDPEVRYFENGNIVAKVSVAVRRDRELTDWFRVEVWGKQAEVLGNFVKKGQMVGISGRMVEDKYTGKDGNERSSWILKANGVHLIASREDASAAPQAAPQAAPAAAASASPTRASSAGWDQAPLAY